MRIWRRLLTFLGLSSSDDMAISARCQESEKAEANADAPAKMLKPVASEKMIRDGGENDCGEDMAQFLLFANNHAKARLRHRDRRGQWWLFETDNEGNLTVTVHRVEQSAPRGLAEFLANRRMSISYHHSCEHAWLEEPEAAAEKFRGALADALLALRATASDAGKRSPLLRQILYPGGDERLSQWLENIQGIYKQALLGVVAISAGEGDQPPQRHFAVVLSDESCQAKSAASEAAVSLVAYEARKIGIAEPTLVLSPKILWEECRSGTPRFVRLLAAAEPLFDTPFLSALRAYDKHAQTVVDRMGDNCRLYLLQGDILGGVPQEDGNLKAAILVNDSAYKGVAHFEELRRNLQQKLEQDWYEATSRCGGRFRFKVCVLFASELSAPSERKAVAALGGGVPLIFRSPLADGEVNGASMDGADI